MHPHVLGHSYSLLLTFSFKKLVKKNEYLTDPLAVPTYEGTAELASLLGNARQRDLRHTWETEQTFSS